MTKESWIVLYILIHRQFYTCGIIFGCQHNKFEIYFFGVRCVDGHIIIPHSDTQQDAYNKDNSTHLLWMTVASAQQNIRHIQTSHMGEAENQDYALYTSHKQRFWFSQHLAHTIWSNSAHKTAFWKLYLMDMQRTDCVTAHSKHQSCKECSLKFTSLHFTSGSDNVAPGQIFFFRGLCFLQSLLLLIIPQFI
jgi:hypothetical protein